MEKNIYDILIIGAGPAGLTAATYARRAGKSVLILERGALGGQMTMSPRIENFPGVISATGNELADRMVEQVLNLGGDFEIDEISEIRDGEIKTAVGSEGEYYGRTVILANGVKHRMLGLDGEEELVGNGISFCAVCDGAFYKDRDVAVIGGGNSALQEAVLLSEVCKKVTVVQNLSFLTGEKKLADIIYAKDNVSIICDTVVDSFMTSGGELSGIVLKNTALDSTTELKCDGVFVAIGLVPENGAFSDVMPLDANGYYAADENCTSPVNGIFVAGDCRAKRIRQVTTAAADGSIAALAACRYVDDLKK